VEAPEEPPSSPEYRPLERRAWLAARWIGLTGALALGLLGLNIAYLSALGQGEDASGIGTLLDLLWLVQLCVHLLGAAIFLAWFYRAYSNARTLGIPFLRHDRGWAIAAWFIPIMALVWPKRMANDAWRASDPELPRNDVDWLKRPVAPIVHLWWAAWLVANFAENAWGRLEPTTVDGLRGATVLAIVGEAAYMVAAVLCILFIRRLTAREEAKARADVPTLALDEDTRAAAEQAARRDREGIGRRIAWYAAGIVLVLLGAAVAATADGESSAYRLGLALGQVVTSLLVALALVQLAGRIAGRRPGLMSAWTALLAVVVMVGVASAKIGAETQSGGAAGSTTQAVDAADTGASACPAKRFRPGRLPAGYRYSELTGGERRELFRRMRLPRDIESRTLLVYVNHRGRTAALVSAVPNAGDPNGFVKGFVDDARRSYHNRVRTKPFGLGTLVITPETYSGIVSTSCTSVTVIGPTRAVVQRLMNSVPVRRG
jgi:hypothetical protein